MENMLTEIVNAAKKDKQSFERLVDLYSTKTYSWCRKLTENQEDINDIMQEAFIKLYRDLPRLNEPEKFNTWFRKVVTNTAYDWFRKHRIKYEMVYIENLMDSVEYSGENTHDIVENKQLGEQIKAAIEKLSNNNRIVYSLFYEHGKKCSDIAKMLDLSETAVKNRLSRAREYLRNELAPYVEIQTMLKGKAFNILIICCSHKKGGVSEEVAEKVKKTILKASPDSTVNVLCLADFEINGCKVCSRCEELSRCSIEDGFNSIYDSCLSADAIIFVSPYYAPIPSKFSALLERMMSVSISPIIKGDNPGRAFPLQKKWCGVLSFSIARTQSYMAGVIREPLVAMGLGLVTIDERLPVETPITEHGKLMGKLMVERLLESPDSNAIDNWFDFWNEENQRIMDNVRKGESKKVW